jgi:hypothetical protein
VAQFNLSDEQRNGSSCDIRIGGGHDWSPRYPLNFEAALALQVASA